MVLKDSDKLPSRPTVQCQCHKIQSYLATDWASGYRPSKAKHSAFRILNLWQAGAHSKARSMQKTTWRKTTTHSLTVTHLQDEKDQKSKSRFTETSYHSEISLIKANLCHSFIFQDGVCILDLPRELTVYGDKVKDKLRTCSCINKCLSC